MNILRIDIQIPDRLAEKLIDHDTSKSIGTFSINILGYAIQEQDIVAQKVIVDSKFKGKESIVG